MMMFQHKSDLIINYKRIKYSNIFLFLVISRLNGSMWQISNSYDGKIWLNGKNLPISGSAFNFSVVGIFVRQESMYDDNITYKLCIEIFFFDIMTKKNYTEKFWKPWIHQCITLSMLVDKINIKSKKVDCWIVNLIRNVRLDAKIISKLGPVVMGTRPLSSYQQLVEISIPSRFVRMLQLVL